MSFDLKFYKKSDDANKNFLGKLLGKGKIESDTGDKELFEFCKQMKFFQDVKEEESGFTAWYFNKNTGSDFTFTFKNALITTPIGAYPIPGSKP